VDNKKQNGEKDTHQQQELEKCPRVVETSVRADGKWGDVAKELNDKQSAATSASGKNGKKKRTTLKRKERQTTLATSAGSGT